MSGPYLNLGSVFLPCFNFRIQITMNVYIMHYMYIYTFPFTKPFNFINPNYAKPSNLKSLQHCQC